MSNTQHFHVAKGFTLVELMIAMVLGLLISAAVFQVYWTNVRTRTVQQSSSEIQDASIFGLQIIDQHIRMANLGNPVTLINDKTLNGGIVLTGFNIGATEAVLDADGKPTGEYKDTYIETSSGYLTRSDGDKTAGSNGWTGLSNINGVDSDQLTIQYHNITGASLFDCEGGEVANNAIVIERYFIRQASQGGNIVLACDAGRLARDADGNAAGVQTFTPATDAKNFGQAGQEIIPGVDQLKVLLGVQSTSGASAGSLRYLTAKDYLDDKKTPATGTPAEKPAIVAVKMGLIVHGTTPVMASSDQTSFKLLGQDNNLKDADSASRAKKVRTTYESTILLRNARVMAVSKLPNT